MEDLRKRKTENVVYLSLWIVAIGLYLLDMMRGRAEMSMPLLDAHIILRMTKTVVPFKLLLVSLCFSGL